MFAILVLLIFKVPLFENSILFELIVDLYLAPVIQNKERWSMLHLFMHVGVTLMLHLNQVFLLADSHWEEFFLLVAIVNPVSVYQVFSKGFVGFNFAS